MTFAIGGNSGIGRTLDPGRFLTSDPFHPDPLSEQLAALSRYQWQQAASMMYAPQNQLIQYAEDPNYGARMRTQAQTDAANAFATQAGARQRLFGLMGINPTSAQSAALDKQSALARAASEAGAMNQAGALAYATQQGALQGFG
jgi:hypothetical protein